MTNVLLISEKTLKSFSLINDNVDGKYISVSIQATQDIDLQNLLGQALVDKLCEMVATNSLTEDYKFLLDEYVTPYMTWQVMSTVQVGLNYKMVNSGVIQNDDERKSHLDYKNNQLLIEQYKTYATSYAMKMKDYLDCNAALYPEYNECVNKQHKNEVNTYGIVF